METKIVEWSIKHLIRKKWDKINSQPDYQRGKVWPPLKKKALVDSILRDIDIPKIYLRNISKSDSEEEYEVADGQQRLDAIVDFFNNGFKLTQSSLNGLDLSKINGFDVTGCNFRDLNEDLTNKIKNYKLTIAIVSGATGDEIRTLFARLQMGNQLNSAEKRNAIISATGHQIDNLALNHSFFKNCRIPKSRFKHQDYITHVIALIAYKNKENLKAILLEKLYRDNSFILDGKSLKKIAIILDFMVEIDKKSRNRIINKFSFIDIFWFLYQNTSSKNTLDIEKFAKEYDKLERNRKKNRETPADLLEPQNKNEYNVLLYNYTIAYEYSGSSTERIEMRNNSFNKLFKTYIA